VSRKHAELKLKEGEFYISDTRAKFGTLVRLEEEVGLVAGKGVRVQNGRSVFEFRVMPEAEDIET